MFLSQRLLHVHRTHISKLYDFLMRMNVYVCDLYCVMIWFEFDDI